MKKTFLNGPWTGEDATKLLDENVAYDITKATFTELSIDMFTQGVADARIVQSSKGLVNIPSIFKPVPSTTINESFVALTSGTYGFQIVRNY